VCAVSEDGGLETYQIHKKAVTSTDFVSFVHVLAERAGGREFAIFMDNLRVHKTPEVLEACKQLRAKPIFNVPYSPDFNGIETFFSQVKAHYKNLVLQKLVKGIRPDVVAAIHQSISSVAKEKVQACVNHGLKNIQQTAKQLGLE
jgi:transposase